jgi:hypothetical protein
MGAERASPRRDPATPAGGGTYRAAEGSPPGPRQKPRRPFPRRPAGERHAKGKWRRRSAPAGGRIRLRALRPPLARRPASRDKHGVTPWLDAFLPAFGLLLLGAVLRARLLPEETLWAGMERLVFWVLLPALLVVAISAVPVRDLPVGGMAVAIWGALGLGTAASLLLARGLGHGHAALTSVLQGGIRFNTMLAFAVTTGLWGPAALPLGGVSAALIVPAVQVVITFAFLAGGGRRLRPLLLLRGLLLNPLLLACLLGFAVSAAGGLPPGIKPLLSVLGQASVAVGCCAWGQRCRRGCCCAGRPPCFRFRR